MQDKSSNTKPDTGGLKPLQSIPYSEKTETWRKQNIEYYIQSSIYKAVQSTLPSDKKTSANNMQLWFNIYNNKINEEDFNYVTNPLNTKNELYKNFPARIRSYNILRPTIDLLIGEWSKRPFKFDVLNLDGDGVINSFNDTKFETYKKNVTQRVVNTIKQSQGEQVEEIPNPKTIIEDINSLEFELILEDLLELCNL